jgi:hypothetical protein
MSYSASTSMRFAGWVGQRMTNPFLNSPLMVQAGLLLRGRIAGMAGLVLLTSMSRASAQAEGSKSIGKGKPQQKQRAIVLRA